MPEYLAPGVFVEEVSFRSKSIEGVSTTTTGFIGATRYGPVTEEPDIITSLGEFERTYGDGTPLAFGADGTQTGPSFVWQAARSFFEEGGKRLYVSRVFRCPDNKRYEPIAFAKLTDGAEADPDALKDRGHGWHRIGSNDAAFYIVARYPGLAGNLRLRFSLKLGPNVLGALPDPSEPAKLKATVDNLHDGDVVWISREQSVPSTSTSALFESATLAEQEAQTAYKQAQRVTAQAKDVRNSAQSAKVVADAEVTKAQARVGAAQAELDALTQANAASAEIDRATTALADATKAKGDADTAATSADNALKKAEATLTATKTAEDELKQGKDAMTAAKDATKPPQAGAGNPGGGAAKYMTSALPIYAASRIGDMWQFRNETSVIELTELTVDSQSGQGDSLYPLALSVEVWSDDGSHSLGAWSGLPLAPKHKTGEVSDSLFDLFGPAAEQRLPLVLINPETNGVVSGIALLEALNLSDALTFALTPAELAALKGQPQGALKTLVGKLTRGIAGAPVLLDRGDNGKVPGAAEYEGRADPAEDYSTGLKQFESIEDISIVAAPGATWNYTEDRIPEVNSIINLLIAHAEHMRYRIAIIDPPEGQKIADVRKQRAKLDSKYAAFYYPWITVLDPITRQRINLPPSGFVAGIYARNDTERAVYKAPANEVVRGAIGFETLINTAQQEVLNPEGINCFRFFEGRGYRLWGARTISSDPEWKYVNLRRYFAYLERSVDKGTQWAVFEPNGEALWANVRASVRDFLVNEWANGALLGDKPEKAFFVRCDRSTMTQNDLDNGRLVCLVGVAPLKPAEFVIFRIGQWTADRQN